ncbi:hypothetical protein FNY86_08100 [Corynebacterium guaraldiae]|uniref:hypothetical protein n=1 Tax=Corynebacterium guaraldiae TaxID=3051103 RepID=UPI001177F48D|nr:hypothetical protein [Corynebacterium guaraldiae]TRX32619.1 hypothetical protein FNY86_08100 [Corynebacterium guaraldiae]TRX39635.1 hypothetical protein FNY89_08995 [Corynebacterium guaraldiae]
MNIDSKLKSVFLSSLRSRPRVVLVSFFMVVIAITALAGGFKPRENAAVPVYDLRDNPTIEGEGVKLSFEGVTMRERIIEPKKYAAIRVTITNKLDRTVSARDAVERQLDPSTSNDPKEMFSVSRAGRYVTNNRLGPGMSAKYEIEKSGEHKFYLFDIDPLPNYRGFINSTLPGKPLAEVRY